jgi:CBS domain-containing protein
MKCKDLMTRDVQVVAPEDTVEAAARLMRDAGIGFLPVFDEREGVIGVLTDRDLAVRVIAEGRTGSTKVSAVMTSEVVTCRQDDDVALAEEIMLTQRKARIMCLDDREAVVGVISLADIARHVRSPLATETLRDVAGRDAH